MGRPAQCRTATRLASLPPLRSPRRAPPQLQQQQPWLGKIGLQGDISLRPRSRACGRRTEACAAKFRQKVKQVLHADHAIAVDVPHHSAAVVAERRKKIQKIDDANDEVAVEIGRARLRSGLQPGSAMRSALSSAAACLAASVPAS